MIVRRRPTTVLLFAALVSMAATLTLGQNAQRLASRQPVAKPIHSESEAEHDRRMKWFREARFGMFIHWGLYAVPAGEWKGKLIPEMIRTEKKLGLTLVSVKLVPVQK